MFTGALAVLLLTATQSLPESRFSRSELPPGILKPPTQVVDYDFTATFPVEPTVTVEPPYRAWSGRWGALQFGIKASRMARDWSMADAVAWMKTEPAQRGQVIEQGLYEYGPGCPGREVHAQVRLRDGGLLRLRLIALERPPSFFYQVYSIVPEGELDRKEIEAQSAQDFVTMFYPCLALPGPPSKP
jgi:hypothetical protein